MDGLLVLAAFATAVAVFVLAYGLQTGLTSTRSIVRARTINTSGQELAAGPIRRRVSPLLRLTKLPFVPDSEAIALELERAGWPIKVGEYLALRLFFAFCFLGLAFLIGDRIGATGILRLLLFVGMAMTGWVLPTRYTLWRRQRRQKQIENQLAEALTTMAKSLRAGAGLLQAMSYTAEETPAPLGPELRRTLRDLQLGADAEVVFHELSRRVGSPDLDIATTALIIQRRVGGNLSEILMNVAHTVRERRDIFGELDVLTSRQKLTANLVALLPIAVAGFFFMVNPSVANLLIETNAGRISLGVGIFFEVFGLWLIRRLAVIEV